MEPRSPLELRFMSVCICFLCFCLCQPAHRNPSASKFHIWQMCLWAMAILLEASLRKPKKGHLVPITAISLNSPSKCFCSSKLLLFCSLPGEFYPLTSLTLPWSSLQPHELPSPLPRFPCWTAIPLCHAKQHSSLSALPHQNISSSSICKIRPTHLRSQDRNHPVLLNHALPDLIPYLIPKDLLNYLFWCFPQGDFYE